MGQTKVYDDDSSAGLCGTAKCERKNKSDPNLKCTAEEMENHNIVMAKLSVRDGIQIFARVFIRRQRRVGDRGCLQGEWLGRSISLLKQL